MSLILDALRKSEAERRRGQAPDLYAELPPLAPRFATRRPAWPWWLAGGFALLASLWLLRDVESTAAAVTAPVAGTSGPLPIPAAAPASLGSRATPPPAPSVAPHAAPEPPTIAAIAPAVPKPVPALPNPTIVAPTAPPLPEPEPPSPPQPSPVEVASATPPPAVITPPAAIPTAAPPLHLADLSAGEREQLPALKISMHMWGPTPAQRFAIIDGARVSQGDRVGDAVVEEIAADSVVLNWRGQRVALPIR